MGRRVANTSVGPKPSSACPNWGKSPKLTLLDLPCNCGSDGLLADNAFSNCVIIAEKTSIRTTIAIPLRIDSLYSKIHYFDNGTQKRHNLLENILKLRSQPPKDTNPPNEVIDMIERQMHKPRRGTHEKLYNRMHHMYHCMLGTCVQGYHAITSPQIKSFVKSFHMDMCSDPAYSGYAKVDLFQDWCRSCAGCDWDDCKDEFALTNKRRCCKGYYCTCSEKDDNEKADDEHVDDEQVEDEQADEEKTDENEDSDGEDKDDCSCECDCECTCKCWCDHDCWRNDEADDLRERWGCRAKDEDYIEQLLGYIRVDCGGKHNLKGDDSEHAEYHLENTKMKVEKKMKLVDQILMRRFGLKLHIVYSRVGEESHDDRLFQIVPLAFLYDPKIDNLETIDTPPEVKDLGTEANYYANAATLISEPKPEATSESDNKLHQEAIAKLKHAMEVLDLKSRVHPMQIQPFQFSTCEEKWEWNTQNWEAARDREEWWEKCNEMEFPRWMALKSMEHASAE